MKSQHRHDLQTNELGRFAEKFAASANEFYASHGNHLWIGIVVVALTASALIIRTKSSRKAEAAAWADLANANQAEGFATVAQAHAGTHAARWARVHEGEHRLNEGVQLAFTNVESADKELKLAKKALQTIVDEKGAPRELRERAQFALALALESMSDGNEGEAVKTYEALIREFPDSIYKKEASSRIAALSSGSGQSFYEWFAKYPRPKPLEKRPHDRMLEDELELRDPLDLPGDLDASKPAESDPTAKSESSEGTAPAKAGDKSSVDELTVPARAKPDEPSGDKLPP